LPRKFCFYARTALAAILALAAISSGEFARAQDMSTRLQSVEERLREQAQRLDAQERALAAQREIINTQAAQINRLLGAPQAAVTQTQPRVAQAQPVGAPPPARPPVRTPVFALPQEASVVTPRGRLVFEPQLEFSHTSANRLVFRGVEIVTGLQIGVIEASDVDRDTVAGSLALRYGLMNRLEGEIRAPYLNRSDRVTTLAQREETATRMMSLRGHDWGDVEAGLRYQLNAGRGGSPIYLANLRVKSNTGTGPYDVARDADGVTSELPTGSGFWGVEPGVTVLYPSDPVVLFANASYLAHLRKRIDKTIGSVRVGAVDPGDSIGLGAGFGFAVNPRFSYSLSYKYNYILRTKSELGNTIQKSEPLQVGALGIGASYMLTDRARLAANVDVGATRDAPDTRVVFRIPYSF
jgi:hypothetical protein